MLDKAKLGRRYSCYECGTKFYDLNRPAPLCPECNADQANAPTRDVKSLLSSGGRKKAPKPDPEEEAENAAKAKAKASSDDDDDDLLGDDDDDLLGDDDDDLGDDDDDGDE